MKSKQTFQQANSSWASFHHFLQKQKSIIIQQTMFERSRVYCSENHRHSFHRLFTFRSFLHPHRITPVRIGVFPFRLKVFLRDESFLWLVCVCDEICKTYACVRVYVCEGWWNELSTSSIPLHCPPVFSLGGEVKQIKHCSSRIGKACYQRKNRNYPRFSKVNHWTLRCAQFGKKSRKNFSCTFFRVLHSDSHLRDKKLFSHVYITRQI